MFVENANRQKHGYMLRYRHNKTTATEQAESTRKL